MGLGSGHLIHPSTVQGRALRESVLGRSRSELHFSGPLHRPEQWSLRPGQRQKRNVLDSISPSTLKNRQKFKNT